MVGTSIPDLLRPSALILRSHYRSHLVPLQFVSGRMLGLSDSTSSPMEQIRDLAPGIYKIENVSIRDCVLDLSGVDNKTIIGLANGTTVVANPYPVSWVFDPSDCGKEDVWKIGWPNNALLFDMDMSGSRHIILQSNDSLSGSRWRLVKLGEIATDIPDQTSVRNPTPQELIIDPPASTTTADTIIDAEGLKLGGNGELAITTTTTTVTTTVTKVKRVAV
ncbi:uncharacterized protein LACBIDRAFT_332331 [Laccaria bicolor S238N-H82]|uniref:Predicted protein n=1 Tax=Laccaria bicolor (strain S238N-H82 / ATCC MYA-4686) TaxID=486041 RepID=B0DSD6_LACBS|nr:uncharacterized protein LACBIDRAFT_332331 [Laccaria bicolor S238N-H82]EDR02526.1 predicted protein [Laccaria bicolor S238N-H82]|eukprot:XP_001886889.1 predicted protein [Laccaria bicolor S238N-H82]